MARFVIEDEPEEVARYDIGDEQEPAESVGMKTGRQMPGEARGFVTAMQGPMFGFLDKLTGGVQGAYKLMDTGDLEQAKQAYRENRDMIRGMEAEYAREYGDVAPVVKTMASLPVMMAVPMPKFSKLGTGIIANMARATVPAAVTGGLTAAGESQGDPLQTAQDAIEGALMSAGTTVVAVPVGAAIGATGRGVLRVGKGIAGKVGAGKLSQAQIERQARAELAKNLARDVKPGSVFDESAMVATGQQTAAGKPVMRAPLSVATEQAAARVGKLGERGMILDLPGGNIRRLADTLAILPGQTKNLVISEQLARRATSAQRIIQAADDAIAAGDAVGRKALKQGKIPPNPALSPTLEALKAQRRANAAPMYQKLSAIEVTADEPLAQAISAMRKLGALREAEAMATADRRVFTLADDILPGDKISMTDLDLAKRGLDQIIHGEIDKVTGAVSPKGSRFIGLLDDFKGYLDDLTTDPATGDSLYRAARSAYAGDTALINAATLGRKALDADKSGKIADEIARLGESEVDAFRVGLLQAIKDKAGSKPGRTQLLSYWENPNVGDKLKAAFGGNFKQFAAALMREERLKGINAINTGSPTAQRLAGMDDLGQAVEDVASVVTSAKTGQPVGFMGGLRNLYQRTAMPEPVRDELGRIMTLQGPAAQQELRSLADLLREIQKQRAINAGRIGATTGGVVGRASVPNNQQ